MIEVVIERESCINCGQCWESCPGFFEENPDDNCSQVAVNLRIAGMLNEGIAPDELVKCVTEAAKDCPAQVIQIRPSQRGFDFI